MRPLIIAAQEQFARSEFNTSVGVAVSRFKLPCGELRSAYIVRLQGNGTQLAGRWLRECFAILVPVHGRMPGPRTLEVGLGLTPSEARLAAQLVCGLSLQDAAEKLSLSEQTARTYLKRMFSKLGISRQNQLVALAARHFVPLAVRTVQAPRNGVHAAAGWTEEDAPPIRAQMN